LSQRWHGYADAAVAIGESLNNYPQDRKMLESYVCYQYL